MLEFFPVRLGYVKSTVFIEEIKQALLEVLSDVRIFS
jgi:hypothetical protein